MKTTIFAVAAALALSACSSVSPTVREAERAERAAEARVERSLSQAPGWYLTPYVTTAQVVFVTGTGSSSALSMSRDKAILDAQAQLADQLTALVSGMTKQYMRDSGVNTTSTLEDTEKVVRKLTAEANVAGYRVEKMEVYPEGRYYRTFVMLAYPIGETNTIRQAQEAARMLRNLPAQRAQAFSELDARSEKAAAQQ